MMPRPTSLKIQFILGATLLLLTLFALMTWNMQRMLKTDIVKDMRAVVHQISETLNLSLIRQTTDEHLSELETYLDALITGEEFGIVYLAVLDEDGHPLAKTNSTPEPLPDTRIPLEKQLGTGRLDVAQPILFSDSRVGSLRYGLNCASFNEAATSILRENLPLMAVGLSITLVTLLLAGARLNARLARLVQTSQALAEGNYAVRAEERGPAEFRQLAHCFNLMASAVDRRTSELILSDRRFRSLFELSPDPVWIISDHRFVACNAAAITMLGYHSKEEFLNTHPSQLSPPFQPDGEDSYAKAERMMNLVQEQGVHPSSGSIAGPTPAPSGPK